MAVPVSYSPQSVIARAMFNFDVFGAEDFTLDGTVRVSVSDAFTSADYVSTEYSYFYSDLWTRGSGEVSWTPTQLENIREILAIYARYADISFQWIGDFDTLPGGADTTVNPEDVGRSGQSDINLTLINRRDVDFAGLSGSSTDYYFDYTGGTGDIFINTAGFGIGSDLSFAEGSPVRQTLMHELGHSLGMSHPHTSYSNDIALISVDFAETQFLGFSKLGFRIESPADMNKEYFTIMSYDDQASVVPNSNESLSALTPMILDVIALQEAYGAGAGTTGPGNDIIEAGNVGYRTYFDTGGIDTIDLNFYYDGAYLDMGEDITGVPQKVGVGMSLEDGLNTIYHGGNPQHLRWFYGGYENAIGSASDDLIVDNSLDNSVSGREGNDFVILRGGNDTFDGGDGYDIVEYLNNYADYAITYNFATASFTVLDRVQGRDGVDLMTSVEEFEFADTTKTAASLIASITADNGNPTATIIAGTPGDDVLAGDAQDNVLNGGAGDDVLNGGGGIDTAMYAGNRAAYTLIGTSTGFAISGGSEGSDVLTGVERLQFADTKIALDLDGAAGSTARMIGAAFGTQYLTNKPLVGIGLSLFDSGTTIEQVAELVLNSALFEQLAGSGGNAAVVSLLYENVLGTAPVGTERDYFVALLDQGMSQADLLVLAANSDINGAHVDIAGLAQTGIEFA